MGSKRGVRKEGCILQLRPPKSFGCKESLSGFLFSELKWYDILLLPTVGTSSL